MRKHSMATNVVSTLF